MIYLDILYFGKFMFAFVPKMVWCDWIPVDILECKSPKEGVRNWFAPVAHTIGMCILIIWVFFFVKKNMTTKHVVTDEYTN